jgi:hypothetical protein
LESIKDDKETIEKKNYLFEQINIHEDLERDLFFDKERVQIVSMNQFKHVVESIHKEHK